MYSPVVHAEDASAAETAAARSLAVDGLKLAQANNCVEALPKLERAEKLYHSAVVAGRLGECYIGVGRLVEGTEVLRKMLREPQASEPTPALTKALERAQKVLDAAKPRIAGLTIKIAAVQDMSVKIDGNPVPSALVDTEIPTDPGEHAIDVSAPGFLKTGTRLSVAEGEKKSIALTLTRDPNAVVPPPSAATPYAATTDAGNPSRAESDAAAPPSTATAERAPNRTVAYVALGVGAAGLATGGVLGLLTMQKHKDLQDQCPANQCGADKQGDLDSAKKLGTLSTVAFGIGGAGVVLGAVLFFTAGASNADHVARAPARRFAGLSKPRLAIGPTQIQFGADF